MKTRAFACHSIQDSRSSSSSGGIYMLLAKEVLKKGGVVFAVCYNEKFETVHKEIRTQEELLQSLGSKYIPSHLNDTLKNVRKRLFEGRQVLFVGTPCQCNGLKQFLGEDCNNLLCIDFVCHGVPSRIAWRQYLDTIKMKGITSINMRDKSTGWSKYQYSWKFSYEDGESVVIPQRNISYMRGFISDFYLRPSCYECRFKGIERITDLTLGDYWGVWDLQPEMDDNGGTSLVFVHTQKGQKKFNDIFDSIVYTPALVEQAVKVNLSIISSARLTEKRAEFFNRIDNGENFNSIVEEMLKPPIKDIIRRKTTNMLRRTKIFREKSR